MPTPNLWEYTGPFKTDLYGYIDIEDYLDLDGLMKAIYSHGVADTEARTDSPELVAVLEAASKVYDVDYPDLATALAAYEGKP